MRRPSATTVAGIGLLLGALGLRPQLVAMGPLLPLIQADTDAPHALIGLVATIPLFCMGLFALAAPWIARRLGPRETIGGCLLAIAVVGLGRGLVPDVLWLIVLTLPIGIGMGIGMALMPVLVRTRFEDRPAFATGLYTNGFQLGSAIAGAVAVPIALAFGGWRGALIVISLATVLLAIGWFRLTPSDGPRPAGDSARGRWPVRSGVAWALTATFALRAIIFQGLIAWMPATYVERGWDASSAGGLTFALIAAGMPLTLVASWLADRIGSRRQYLASTAGTLVLAMAGLYFIPEPGWLWAVLIGASLGVLFPLTLTLPLDIADRPADVAAAASMMLGFGYMISAVGPIGLGAIRDATGSFANSIAALAVVAGGLLVATLALTPERLAARRRSITAEHLAG